MVGPGSARRGGFDRGAQVLPNRIGEFVFELNLINALGLRSPRDYQRRAGSGDQRGDAWGAGVCWV